MNLRLLPAAFLLVAGLLLAACSGDSASQPLAATVTLQATIRPIIIIPLGRTARSNEGEVTIHEVRRSSDEGGSVPPEGREWLLVEVSVRNTSPQPIALHIRFRDRDEIDLKRAYPPGVEPALDAPLQPGAEVRGEVAFLAPKGMLGGTIVYGPGDERWALQMGMFPIDE